MSDRQPFLRVPRELLAEDSPVMSDPFLLRALLYLGNLASYRDRRWANSGTSVNLQVGETHPVSRRYLEEAWKCGSTKTTTILAILVKFGLVKAMQQTRQGTTYLVDFVSTYNDSLEKTKPDPNQIQTRSKPDPNQIQTRSKPNKEKVRKREGEKKKRGCADACRDSLLALRAAGEIPEELQDQSGLWAVLGEWFEYRESKGYPPLSRIGLRNQLAALAKHAPAERVLGYSHAMASEWQGWRLPDSSKSSRSPRRGSMGGPLLVEIGR